MLDSKLVISEHCVAEKLDDKLIILNLSTGMYHQLNAIGIIIWEQIEKHSPTFEALVTQLQQQFNAPHVASDVREFVDALLERNIILKE